MSEEARRRRLVLTDEFYARIEAPSDIQDYLAFLHQEAFEIASRAEHPVLTELGVRAGNSTCAFLLALARAQRGELWSVDISPPSVPAPWHALPWWHLLVADDRSARAQAWLPRQTDLLFIDTSHSYEHTLSELGLYVPRVRPGGVVLLHDTQWEPPALALPEPTGPVAEALTLFCTSTGRCWENQPGKYGLGVIRV